MNRGNFYGPSSGGLTVPNNVDISQRTAEGPGPGDDEAEHLVKLLRGIPGLQNWHVWGDPQKLKRFTDEMRGALAGYDTTQAEDSRLRQESPEEKPFNSDEFWNSEEPKRVMPRKL